MLLTLLTHLTAAVGGYVVGHLGLPVVVAYFKTWSAKRAIAAAKAVVAKAEADAKALAAAKAVIAAAPPAPTGATGPAA